MKRFIIIFVSILLASGLAFGINFEFSGGLRSLGMTLSGTSMTSGFEYDASVGLGIPLNSQFSIMLNGGLLGFSSGSLSDLFSALTNPTVYTLTGGARYTVDWGSLKPFVGAGAGVIGSGSFSALSSGNVLPLVEVNGGIMIPFSASSSFFVKGAFDMVFTAIENYFVMVNLMQLTAGINF